MGGIQVFTDKNSLFLSKGKDVVFYSIPTNPSSKRIRELLVTSGASFTEVDVTTNPLAAETAIKLGGGSGPVVDASGTVVKGFSEKQLSAALLAIRK